MEEEGEDVNFISNIVIIIIVITLLFLFRSQIEDLLVSLTDSIQTIIK